MVSAGEFAAYRWRFIFRTRLEFIAFSLFPFASLGVSNGHLQLVDPAL